MKRTFALLCSLVMLMSFVSGCGNKPAETPPAQEGASTEETVTRTPQTITVGCSTATGVGYITTTTLGAILQKEYPEYVVAPEITTGSQENVNLVAQGVAQIAVCMADSALAAYEGNREFADAPISTAGKIAFLCGGSPTGITQFVSKNVDAEELPDVKGMRVAVTSGTMANFYWPVMLEAYGLTESDFKSVTKMSIKDAVAGIQDGNLDYAVHCSSMPHSAISDLSVTTGIKVLNISDEIAEKIIEKNPYFERFVIPTTMYNTEKEANTLVTRNCYVADVELDEQVAYDWVKTLYDFNEDMTAASAQAGMFVGKDGWNALNGQTIPLHPGAERFYREVGIIK